MEFEVIDTRVGQFDQVKTVISSLDLNQLCKIEFKLELFKQQIDHQMQGNNLFERTFSSEFINTLFLNQSKSTLPNIMLNIYFTIS